MKKKGNVWIHKKNEGVNVFVCESERERDKQLLGVYI